MYTDRDGNADLLQEEAYYPFGMRIPSMSKSYSGSSDDRYLYNGKELEDRIKGFHFSDYGARFYDPALGCWHSVDPLAEKGREWSPYTYCFNNPMKFIDRDGKWASLSEDPVLADWGKSGYEWMLEKLSMPYGDIATGGNKSSGTESTTETSEISVTKPTTETSETGNDGTIDLDATKSGVNVVLAGVGRNSSSGIVNNSSNTIQVRTEHNGWQQLAPGGHYTDKYDGVKANGIIIKVSGLSRMDITVVDPSDIYDSGFRYSVAAMSWNILMNSITGPLRGYPGDTFYPVSTPPPGW